MSQLYFLRLLPPRPSFVADMTDSERALMGEHAAYARRVFDAGKLLAYGPVFDPEGSFGMAVLQVDSEAELQEFMQNDPTVIAGMNRYASAPMRLGGSQAPRPA